jgi:hypothetical protein
MALYRLAGLFPLQAMNEVPRMGRTATAEKRPQFNATSSSPGRAELGEDRLEPLGDIAGDIPK